MRRLVPFVAGLGMLATLAVSQQSNSSPQSSNQQGNQQGNGQQGNQQNQPAPLFGGQIGTKSSQTTKENAGLGFNGVDPSGKVEKKMLGANPSAKDVEAVNNMDSAHPSRTELSAFVKQGGLKSK
jgi:hypothetical protein